MNRILFVAIFLASAGLAQGQSSYKPVYWDAYGGFTVQGGVQALQTRSSNLEVFYVDESGFNNVLQAFKSIDGKGRAANVAFSFEGGRIGGMHYEGGAAFVLGNPWQAMLSVGAGHNFQVGRLILRPKVQAGISIGTTQLGRVRNPDPGYFQVDEAQFWEEDIRVSLGESYLFALPTLDILYPISPTLALKGYIGYNIPLSIFDPRVRFTGSDASGNSDDGSNSATERLTDSNVELYNNNARTTSLSYVYKGLTAGVGLAVNLIH